MFFNNCLWTRWCRKTERGYCTVYRHLTMTSRLYGRGCIYSIEWIKKVNCFHCKLFRACSVIQLDDIKQCLTEAKHINNLSYSTYFPWREGLQVHEASSYAILPPTQESDTGRRTCQINLPQRRAVNVGEGLLPHPSYCLASVNNQNKKINICTLATRLKSGVKCAFNTYSAKIAPPPLSKPSATIEAADKRDDTRFRTSRENSQQRSQTSHRKSHTKLDRKKISK